MASSVRAAVLVKPKTLEAREFARPAIGLHDALLRIEACGICGNDYEQYEGAQPHHEDYAPYPVIPGHEPLVNPIHLAIVPSAPRVTLPR